MSDDPDLPEADESEEPEMTPEEFEEDPARNPPDEGLKNLKGA